MTYDANCNCTGGTYQDSDGDGVCNVYDQCEGHPDDVDNNNNGIPDGCDGCTLTGQSCNDNDPCTINDTYNNNCDCVGQDVSFLVTSSSTDAVCEIGGSITLAINNYTQGDVYEFRVNGQTPQVTNTGTATFDNLNDGDYSFTIISRNATDCSITIDEEVQDGSGALDAILIHSDVTCDGADGEIFASVNGVGNYSYSLIQSGVEIASIDVTGNNHTFENLSGGNYTVQIISKTNGCRFVDDVNILSTNSLSFEAVLIEDQECFEQGSIRVFTDGGTGTITTTYQQIAGSGGNGSFLGLLEVDAGTYLIEVVDGNGCSIDTTIIVENFGAPTVNVTTEDADCGTLGVARLSIDGNTGPYSIFGWDNQDSLTLFGLPGTYNVTVIDNNKCSQDITIDIGGTEELSMTVLATPLSCGISNVEVSTNRPADIVVLDLLDMEVNASSISTSNEYLVRATTADGCVTEELIFVDVLNNMFDITINPSSMTEFCTGETGSIIASCDNCVLSVNGIEGSVFNDLPAGSYTVRGIDSFGCITETIVDLTHYVQDSIIVTKRDHDPESPLASFVDFGVFDGTITYSTRRLNFLGEEELDFDGNPIIDTKTIDGTGINGYRLEGLAEASNSDITLFDVYHTSPEGCITLIPDCIIKCLRAINIYQIGNEVYFDAQRYAGPSGQYTVRIFDIGGQFVETGTLDIDQNGNGILIINISNYQSGIYFARFTGPETFVEKFYVIK